MPPDLYCVIPPDFDEMELLHQIRWIGRYGDNSPENAWYQHAVVNGPLVGRRIRLLQTQVLVHIGMGVCWAGEEFVVAHEFVDTQGCRRIGCRRDGEQRIALPWLPVDDGRFEVKE